MYKQKIYSLLESYLEDCGLHLDFIPNVDYSSYEDFHYQTSIFLQIKKQMPDFDGNTIVKILLKSDIFEKVQITGNGFISMKMKISECNMLEPSKHIYFSPSVIVDYCGANIAKQMHIGHIRSMFIGDFIVRLLEATGHNVIIQNHIGDFGNQFGYLINYILEHHMEFANDELTIDNKAITEIYKKATEENELFSIFANRSAEIAKMLQTNSNFVVNAIWEKLVEISMNSMQDFFDTFKLKINKKDTRGESFYVDKAPAILDDLISKNIATRDNDGSVFVELEKSKIVLQKSNGNFLYPLFDIAAIAWRVKKYEGNMLSPLVKIVYVTDSRQILHFQQVFEIAKLAGYATNCYGDNVELVHVPFGTILSANKKPLKTKSGDSLYMDELLEEGKQLLLTNQHFCDFDPPWFKDEVFDKTLIGALKFYDLKLNKEKDYVFDWNNALSLVGNSAPYIQYAYVRIDSICFKSGDNVLYNSRYNNIRFHFWEDLNSFIKDEIANAHFNDDELDLLFKIQKSQEIIYSISDNFKNQILVNHLLDIAGTFHKYHHNHHVIGSENEHLRVKLLRLVGMDIRYCASILGIEMYDCKEQVLD